MKRLLFGMLSLGLVAGFATGCTSDPTAALRGSVAGVQSNRAFAVIAIGDSISVSSWTVDEQGNTLTLLPTPASANAGVVSLSADSSLTNRPANQAFYFAKGTGHGTTVVIASAEGFADTIQFEAFPASVEFVSPPDTVGSGETGTFVCDPQDRGGTTVTGDPVTCTYESSDTDVVEVVDSTGAWAAKAPGIASVTVVVDGGADNSTALTVEPGTFAGTLSASTGTPGQTVTITKDAAGPDFDADTHVFFGGVEAFIDVLAAGAIDVIVPATGVAGAVELLLTNLGAGQLAQTAAWTSVATLNDAYDPNATCSAAAPAITAGNNYYLVLDPADTDNFFAVDATGGAVTLTITSSWFTGADVDLLWQDTATCSGFVGNFSGATGANPEVSTVTVPAGAIWNLRMNLYAAGSAADNVMFAVTP